MPHVDTLLVQGSASPPNTAAVELAGPFSPTSMPIYQTATFASPNSLSTGLFDYSRSGNPTRQSLERQLAAVEGSAFAFAFTTGMAALSVVTQLLRAGEGVLGSDDMYGGTVRLLSKVLPTSHSVQFTDLTDLQAVERKLRLSHQSPDPAQSNRPPSPIRLILVRQPRHSPHPNIPPPIFQLARQ